MADPVNLSKESMAELAKALQESGSTFNTKDIDSLTTSVRAYAKTIREGQPALKGFKDLLSGYVRPMTDVTDRMGDLDDQIKKAIETEKKSIATEDAGNQLAARRNRIAIESAKVELERAAAFASGKSAFSNLAVGVGRMAGTMYDATIEFAKGLQDGQAGTELYANSVKRAAAATGELAESSGKIMQGVGGMLTFATMFTPAGRIGKILTTIIRWTGVAMQGLGIFAEETGKKAAKVLGDGAEMAGKELANTKKSFEEITSAGAMLAGGMTEMRKMSVESGLGMGMFSEAVKANQDNLIKMGIGMTDATKRFAGINKNLRDPAQGLSDQLYNLGYSFKEQAELSAFTSAQLNASGRLRTMTDKEVAEETLKYGKNLKVLQEISGKDAKAAMEKAKVEASRREILGAVTTRFGVGGQDRVQARLVGMTDKMMVGFKQFVQTGTYADQSLRILNAQTGGSITKYFEGILKDTADETKKGSDLVVRNSAELTQLNESLTSQEAFKATAGISAAASFGKGPGSLQGVIDMQSEAIAYKQMTGDAKKAKTAVDATAKSDDKLLEGIRELDNKGQELAASWTKLTTGPLTKFVSFGAAGTKMLEGWNEQIKLFSESVEGAIDATKSMVVEEKTDISGTVGGIMSKIGLQRSGEGSEGGGKRGMFGQLMSMFSGPSGGEAAAARDQAKGLKIKSNESVSGGAAKDGLITLATQIQNSLGGDLKYFSAFNDMYHQGLDRKSSHTKGTALDFVLTDPSKAEQYAAMVKSMPGVKPGGVINEYAKLSAGGTGGHIHAEIKDQLAEGGVTRGLSLAGENGPEAVVPLPDGRTIPVKIDWSEMRETFDEMIRVMKDHKDTSNKLLRASA
jgi:hypothetical protein